MTVPFSEDSPPASSEQLAEAAAVMALGTADELLRRMVASVSDFAIFALDRDRVVRVWNTGAVQLFGYTEQEMLGRSGDILFVSQDLASRAPEQEVAEAMATGRGADERWHLRKDGSQFYGSGVLTPLWSPTKELRGFCKVLRDVTGQHEAQMRDAFFTQLSEINRKMRDPQEIFWNIIHLTGMHLAASRCCFVEVDASEETFTVHRDYVNGVASLEGRHRLDAFGPELVLQLRRGETLVVHDAFAEAGAENSHDAFTQAEVRSTISVPLIKEGQLVAIFALHQNIPRVWTPSEVHLIEQVAERAGLALENARSELAVREAVWLTRKALEVGGGGAWLIDLDRGLLVGDSMLSEMFDVPIERCRVGEPLESFFASIHEEDRARVQAAFETSLETGDAYQAEYRVRGRGGIERWVEAHGEIEKDATGRAVRMPGVVLDITGRKKADEALRESETRYRLVSEAANDAIWDWDLVTNGVTWNDGISRFFGYAPGDIGEDVDWWIGKIELADRERVTKSIYSVIDGRGDLWSDEYRFQRADGSYAAVFDRGRLVRDVDGKPRRMVGSLLDLTERKKAEALLKERTRLVNLRAEISALLAANLHSHEGLQGCCELLVRHLDAAFARIWTLDRTGQILELQASAGLYTHLDGEHGRVPVGKFKIGRIAQNREPLLTNDVANDPNISEPDWAKREGMVAFAGYPLLFEETLVGVVALFSHRAFSPTVLSDLAPIVDSIARNISRRLEQDALRRSETTARFLAQASADLAEVTDPLSTLQSVASTAVPAFADWCTVDLAEEDGSLKRVAVTHADPAKVREAREIFVRFPPRTADPHGVLHVLHTGQSELFSDIPADLFQQLAHDPVHLKYLESLDLRSYISVSLHRPGRSLGVITFITAESGLVYTDADLRVAEDLARRAAIAIENSRLYHELREADQRKDEFLATLAHELRNPLAPIRSALHLLEQSGDNPSTFTETRELMGRQLNQMVRLVDDLLDVSRITRGTIELRRQRVSLADLVRSAVEISTALIAASRHTLVLEVSEEPITLNADPVRIAQVISNLLNNSARYTEPGGRISLQAKTEAGQVAIRVADNGVGIAPQMLPHIFEMFTQVDRSLESSQGGLGIGLTLVKRLVEMHGGTVEAHSAGLGFGSQFTVRLPQALPEVVSPVASFPKPNPAPAIVRRILVVDDNRDAATILSKLLTRTGHTVHTAYDGLEAVAAAERFQPGIILLDIGLPGINGYDAAARIRKNAGIPSPVLIALTGWGQENDRRQAREAGFDFHLVKPVDFGELQSLLANLPA